MKVFIRVLAAVKLMYRIYARFLYFDILIVIRSLNVRRRHDKINDYEYNYFVHLKPTKTNRACHLHLLSTDKNVDNND